jgi:sec-independent protein translocase protein TatC
MSAQRRLGDDYEDTYEDYAGEARMGFLEHLDELRSRLIRACIALVAGMAVSFVFALRLGDLLLAEILASLPRESSLIYSRPGEGFAFYLDLSLMGGLILAAPFMTYQVWRFIAPGLHKNEKRLVVPFLALAICGTVAGTLFSHFVLFPSMMSFFAAFDSPLMRFLPRVEDTFELYKNTLIGMIAVFQIPTLVFVLARLGIVTAGFLWRHVSYAILVAAIASALLTPSSDPWNQLVFAAPMIAMYLLGIGIAWLCQRRPDSKTGGGAALQLVFAAGIIEGARRRDAVDRHHRPRLVRSRR